MPEIVIKQADMGDLDAVVKLEERCFPKAEAASKKAFECRLMNYPECFWLLEKGGQLIGMINGMTTDLENLCDEMYSGTDLYAPKGKWLMLFGVATDPEYQHMRFACMLMKRVVEDSKNQKRHGIVLTCKDQLIPFYSQFGFVSEGISNSEHGGAVWYQMRLTF